MTGPRLCLDDVTLGYDRHPAVHHLSGCFDAGTLTAVVGPNGGGKSTLLKALMGLLRPLSGRVLRHGVSPDDIAYLPQAAEIDCDFPISVRDVVLMGHWRRNGAFGAASPDDLEQVRRALAGVGLAGFEDRPIGSLSIGQRQRVLFARTWVADCRVILLDEPFAAVDARTTADLLTLILDWHAQGRLVIAVLHDFQQVRTNFPRSLMLAREMIAWGPTAEVLTAATIERGRAMSEAWDQDAAVCERTTP